MDEARRPMVDPFDSSFFYEHTAIGQAHSSLHSTDYHETGEWGRTLTLSMIEKVSGQLSPCKVRDGRLRSFDRIQRTIEAARSA